MKRLSYLENTVAPGLPVPFFIRVSGVCHTMKTNIFFRKIPASPLAIGTGMAFIIKMFLIAIMLLRACLYPTCFGNARSLINRIDIKFYFQCEYNNNGMFG